jgi:hypothetical protein
MCVLCVAMMFWTTNAEDAMKRLGLAGLNQFYDKLLQQVSLQILK